MYSLPMGLLRVGCIVKKNNISGPITASNAAKTESSTLGMMLLLWLGTATF
jgi:hypothetical protein